MAEYDRQQSNQLSKAILHSGSKNSQLKGFVDNRPHAASQIKLINSIQKKPNNTGLPDDLKSGIENLSGYSMDDVNVHYNSDKPAQLSALAYAQGTDIHVAPGQERHLPHEAWHVVQQKQGRVQPTMQMQGVNVNDNSGLEREADMIESKYDVQNISKTIQTINNSKPIQRKIKIKNSNPEKIISSENEFLLFVLSKQEHILSNSLNDEQKIKKLKRTVLKQYFINAQNNSIVEEKTEKELSDMIMYAKYHILSTHKSKPDILGDVNNVTFGDAKKEGVIAYAKKNIGVHFLNKITSDGITKIIISTNENTLKDGFDKCNFIDEEANSQRRKSLTILNYSTIYQKDKELLLIVKSFGLGNQFGLAIKIACPGIDVLLTEHQSSYLATNYERLSNFISNILPKPPFNNEQNKFSLVFGYYNSFTGNTNIEAFGNNEEGYGWKAQAYKKKNAADNNILLVLDSSIDHSYHVEVLSKNVKALLNNSKVKNFVKRIENIFAGGSAGSLLSESTLSESTSEDTHKKHDIVIPKEIETTDSNTRIKNALADSSTKESVHKSVLSVFNESADYLEYLHKSGIETLDMEFGFLAKVINSYNLEKSSNEEKIKFGVALLITDFPRIHAENTSLAQKGHKDLSVFIDKILSKI